MDTSSLVQAEGGVSSSIRVTDTSVDVTLYSTYAWHTRYLYHCIYATTLGPQLLSVYLTPYHVWFLDAWSQASRYYTYSGFFGVLVILDIVFFALYMNSNVSRQAWVTVTAVGAVIGVIHIFLDILLFFFVRMPINIVWRCALTFREENISDSNVFLKASLTHQAHVVLSVAEEGKVHEVENIPDFLCGYLEQHRADIKIMLYKSVWSKKYRHAAIPRTSYTHGLYAAWLVQCTFLVANYLLTYYDDEEGDDNGYEDDDNENENLITFFCFNVVFSPFIILVLTLMYNVVVILIKIVFVVGNGLLCNLPKRCIMPIYESFFERVRNHGIKWLERSVNLKKLDL